MHEIIQNLDRSRTLIANTAVRDFWLEPDGTIVRKTWSLWTRIIRWIQNYFFNTTICNIVQVFNVAANHFLAIYNQIHFGLGSDSVDSLSEQLNEQAQRIQFIASFLIDRPISFLNNPTSVQEVMYSLEKMGITPPAHEELVLFLQEIPFPSPHISAIEFLQQQDEQILPLTHKGISLAPIPFQISSLPNPQESLSDLLQLYLKLKNSQGSCTIWQKICQPFMADSAYNALHKLCQCIQERRASFPAICKDSLPLFYSCIEQLLKNCIALLKNDQLTTEKKYAALQIFCEGASYCGPRVLEEGIRFYKRLANIPLSIDQQIHIWKQNFFEEEIQAVFLSHCKHTPNVLNWIRVNWGLALGLHQEQSSQDACLEKPPCSLNDIIQILQNAWPRFATLLIDLINQEPPGGIPTAIALFLEDSLKHHYKIPHPREYVNAHYFSSDFKITQEGVNHLLREIYT